MCWSPSMPITCRSIVRRRSTSGKAFTSTVRRWPTGSGGRRSSCVRSANAFWRFFGLRRNCSPTRRRRLCSIPVEGERRPGSSGPMRATTRPLAAPGRRWSPIGSRTAGRATAPSVISAIIEASCNATAMPAIASLRRSTRQLAAARRMLGAPAPPVLRSPRQRRVGRGERDSRADEIVMGHRRRGARPTAGSATGDAARDIGRCDADVVRLLGV